MTLVIRCDRCGPELEAHLPVMAIANDVELLQAMTALTDLRMGIAALRRDVPNPRNFAVMIEGSLDEIARIEADIAQYLGLDARAELEAHLPERNDWQRTWDAERGCMRHACPACTGREAEKGKRRS